MLHKTIPMISIILLLISSCKSDKSSINSEAQNNFGIIPAPNGIALHSDKLSDIKELKIYLPSDISSSYLDGLIGQTKNASMVSETEANVTAAIDPKMAAEAYEIDILQDKISIKAANKGGVQYAIVSLSQMVTFSGYPLPTGKVEDNPKFVYRGMHLDVARHFFSVDDVKKHLDYMAYYKYNNFHWHLTEDQGWRIEIKKYPKLQQIAAYRKETLIGHYNDQPHKFDGQKYGGFYTQEEIKDVVAYATARNINVIPEIEMPGHAQAAIAAYPELGCRPGPYEVATKWGVFEDVFCPNEVTFKFLQDVIDEIIPLFPCKYIHIGGDECPKTAWEKSEFCQKLIKEQGIESGEHGLQSYIISRMEKYINGKGKQIVGWDEILEGGLAPNSTVMSWRGVEGGIEAARQNHDVIMTPGTHCYFDHYQSESPNEPLAIGGLTTVEKVYGWEPIPDSLEADKRKYILGGQANLWSEYIKEYDQVEYMVYARGMAMAEALWSIKKDYPEFLKRYELHNEYWKSKGANMAYHVYELKPKITAGMGNPISIDFDLPEGTEVSFSFNGKTSQVQPGKPTIIDKSGEYTFTAGKGTKKGQPLSLIFDLHKATNAKISLEKQASPKYAGNGPGSIVNGVMGSSEKYGGTEWLGFEGDDCIGTLDFGKEEVINEVNFTCFKGEGQWIYLPKKIEVFASADGKTFTSIKVQDNIVSDNKIAHINLQIQNTKTRYLKFHITNFGIIPAESQGGGHPAWLFVDEVIVK